MSLSISRGSASPSCTRWAEACSWKSGKSSVTWTRKEGKKEAWHKKKNTRALESNQSQTGSSDATYSCWVDATVMLWWSAGHEAKLRSSPTYMNMFSDKKVSMHAHHIMLISLSWATKSQEIQGLVLPLGEMLSPCKATASHVTILLMLDFSSLGLKVFSPVNHWMYFHLKHNISLHTSTSVMLTIGLPAVLTDIWHGSYSLKMRVVAGFSFINQWLTNTLKWIQPVQGDCVCTTSCRTTFLSLWFLN